VSCSRGHQPARGGDIKRAITVIIVLLIIAYIVKAPESAAQAARAIWNGIIRIFDGFAEFLRSL
jgi:hypothetical protein